MPKHKKIFMWNTGYIDIRRFDLRRAIGEGGEPIVPNDAVDLTMKFFLGLGMEGHEEA
jgi:hypothetical protein